MDKKMLEPEKERGGFLRFIIVLLGVCVIFAIIWYAGLWDVMNTPDRLLAVFAGLLVLLLLGIKSKKRS